jgi:DNA primase
LGDRKLLGETVRKFGMGYAPVAGDWLARQADKAPVPIETLLEAGLLGTSSYGSGYYDRFRDRVMFPIRNLRGETVGFGGRILPTSAFVSTAPKYYNSADSAIFKKGELVYGLDQARLAAQSTGFLAVVEGYTDVLMAHQAGVTNVVATMGTALTPDHIRQMRRFAPRIVLVFDSDEGGATGVARALELFVREDVDLAIATLPNGLDPHDLLTQQGSGPFREALTNAVDVLEFKLQQLLTSESGTGVEAGRRAVEAVLGIVALAPVGANSATEVRRQLILSRVAHRFGLREATLWARLDELRKARPVERVAAPLSEPDADEVAVARTPGSAAADPLERQLVEALLAEPVLTAKAKAEVSIEEISHPGLQRILTEMYTLLGMGIVPDIDALRMRLIDKPKLADFALRALEVGQKNLDRLAWLQQVLQAFRTRRMAKTSGALKSQLKSTTAPEDALDLLRKLQETTAGAG